MADPQISLKSRSTTQEPKKKPEAPQEPMVIKIVYVYVPVPKEYVDDPFLTCEQVMEIMGWKKQKTYNTMKLMTHYKEDRCIRVRKSWLQKWNDNHTEYVDM
jgi:hypothetical protein